MIFELLAATEFVKMYRQLRVKKVQGQAIFYAEYLQNDYSTETVPLIFPFLQTNITVQMRPSGGYGPESVVKYIP